MSPSSTTAALVALAITTAPTSADVRKQIQALYDGGEYEQALTLTINEYRTSGGEGVFLYAGANAAKALGDCPQATELWERALAKADNPQIKASIAAEIQACRDESVDETVLPATFVVRWGDAERALGRCDEATASYRRALRRQASDAETATARDGIDACKPPPPRIEAPPPPADPKPPPPRKRDRVSPILFGTGAGLAIVGGALIGSSAARARGADQADERRYRDQTSQANALLATGITVAGVGVGVLLTATVRWAILRQRRADSPSPRATRHP